MFGHSSLRCYGRWMQEGFVRGRISLSPLRMSRRRLYKASTIDTVSKIREMAVPKKRASAAQMLVKYYNGVGLSTPRNQAPALISSPSPAITAARAPALAFPALTTRTTQTKITAMLSTVSRKLAIPSPHKPLAAYKIFASNQTRAEF